MTVTFTPKFIVRKRERLQEAGNLLSMLVAAGLSVFLVKMEFNRPKTWDSFPASQLLKGCVLPCLILESLYIIVTYPLALPV